MLKQTVACNACGAERKEANHWFVLLVEYDKEVNFGGLSVAPLNELTGAIEGVEHLCGEACVLKRVAALLPTLTTVDLQA